MDAVNGAKKSTTKTEDMQGRFLTLLTTQLKNQDPLNPMDNAQMTSQLAQISTVDGIERLNATLEKMLAGSATSEVMQAAALVGNQVMVAGSAMSLTESGAVGGVELKSAADKVTVSIRDANGALMRKLELGKQDAGIVNFVWDGKTDAGATAEPGNYKISVEATRGTTSVESKALQLASVLAVRQGAKGVDLDLGSYGLITMNDIKQIF